MKFKSAEELIDKVSRNYVEIDKVSIIISNLESVKHHKAFANVKRRQEFTIFINKAKLRFYSEVGLQYINLSVITRLECVSYTHVYDFLVRVFRVFNAPYNPQKVV